MICLMWLCPTAPALRKDLQSNPSAEQLTCRASNTAHTSLTFPSSGVLIYSKAIMWVTEGSFLVFNGIFHGAA